MQSPQTAAEDRASLLARLDSLERELTELKHRLAADLLECPLPTGRLELVICRGSYGRFAIALDTVEQVLPVASLTLLPEAPPWVLGTLNLRGESLAVVDVERRLTGIPRRIALTDRIVVCRSQWHRAGLLVEDVCEVQSVDAEAACHPAPGTTFAPYLIALLHHPQGALPLIDVARLLSLSGLPGCES